MKSLIKDVLISLGIFKVANSARQRRQISALFRRAQGVRFVSCVTDLMPAIVSRATRAGEQLSALASELLARRDEILKAWRAAGELDAERSIASSLSRAQFNDHIPAVLDCLAHTIEAWPDGQTALAELRSRKVYPCILDRGSLERQQRAAC